MEGFLLSLLWKGLAGWGFGRRGRYGVKGIVGSHVGTHLVVPVLEGGLLVLLEEGVVECADSLWGDIKWDDALLHLALNEVGNRSTAFPGHKTLVHLGMEAHSDSDFGTGMAWAAVVSKAPGILQGDVLGILFYEKKEGLRCRSSFLIKLGAL
eukprot:scaffold9688_cov108-Amphora_coffeaeformis.AAC.2